MGYGGDPFRSPGRGAKRRRSTFNDISSSRSWIVTRRDVNAVTGIPLTVNTQTVPKWVNLPDESVKNSA